MNESRPVSHLIGIVNTGKSTLFRALAGKKISEITSENSSVIYHTADFKGIGGVIVDPPGISSVIITNEDERISRNLVFKLNPDRFIQVLDAHNMTRSLAQALQFAEFEIPTVIAMNMDDMAQSRGIIVNDKKLSNTFGVPVTRTVASEKLGVDTLREFISDCTIPKRVIKIPPDIEKSLSLISAFLKGHEFSARGAALLLVAEDPSIRSILSGKVESKILDGCEKIVKNLKSGRRKSPALVLSELFLFHARAITDEIVTRELVLKTPFINKLGRLSSGIPVGAPIALLLAVGMYFFVGELGAQFLVGYMEGVLFGEHIVPWVESLTVPLGMQWVTDMFCGDFGLVSMGLSLAIGVLLPVLLTFYLYYGILEDSGYLPRLTVLLDSIFRKIGLTGKGVLPLIMGFSCITMAILTARMLDSKKERIIVTLLLTLGIPCAPLLAMMFVIFAKLHWTAMLVVFGVLTAKMILAGVISNRLIPGKRSDFIIEIPPLRIPTAAPIVRRAFQRLFAFLKEAVPVFLLAALILFVFDKIGGLNLLRTIAHPTVKFLLDLPEQSVELLIMTLVRREAGAAMLDQMFLKGLFSGVQTVVIIIVMTSILPCVNAVVVMFKERGFKTSMYITAIVMPAAILAGTAVNYACKITGLSF